MPTIKFFDADRDFRVNNIGEQGELVENGFEYNSGENPRFLTIEELRDELRRKVY
jgi:UDP-N-acetylglucosamine 4,6-dehydratase